MFGHWLWECVLELPGGGSPGCAAEIAAPRVCCLSLPPAPCFDADLDRGSQNQTTSKTGWCQHSIRRLRVQHLGGLRHTHLQPSMSCAVCQPEMGGPRPWLPGAPRLRACAASGVSGVGRTAICLLAPGRLGPTGLCQAPSFRLRQ